MSRNSNQDVIKKSRPHIIDKKLSSKLDTELETYMPDHIDVHITQMPEPRVSEKTEPRFVCVDGSEAVANIAYALNELMIIYPISPSTTMSEFMDTWSGEGRENIYGEVPSVIQMQSEAGVAGALHGALTTSSLVTTFTSSQGLLLMIPNFYKIAGEMLPVVVHVAARSLACSGLSMYCDHADVMACRQTGFVMLSSNNPQEAQDMALIASRATFCGTLPILHFFDGFRTSHEIQKIVLIEKEQIDAFIDKNAITDFRNRALDPEKPTLRGTAQNPDIYFSGREAVNKVYNDFGAVFQKSLDLFEIQFGRSYKAFEYYGDPEAIFVIALMGSAVDTVKEVVTYLNQLGRKYGVVAVRLYRPFKANWFVQTLPKTIERLVVLDRTKEPGSQAEPLCLDIIGAIQQMRCEGNFPVDPIVVGGRYGLGSFEFTPAMVKGIFDALENKTLKHNFTVGIDDDVMHTSIDYKHDFFIPSHDIYQAIFYGLGSDGTVSANKNMLKIIGEKAKLNVQGYFSYEAKKAGSMTISFLRIANGLVNKPYLIENADFVACHKFGFLMTYDVLRNVKVGGVFLLASLYSAEDVWDKIPHEVQEKIIEKKLHFYVVNAHSLARRANLSGKINIVMQVAAFQINKFLPEHEFYQEISNAIRVNYGHKGEEIVQKNLNLLEMSLSALEEVHYPKIINSKVVMRDFSLPNAPKFVQEVTGVLLANRELLPVSKIPPTGVWPVGTSQYEKRNIAEMIPQWDEKVCINCGMCAMVCPHAAIRIKAYSPEEASDAPSTLKSKLISRGPLEGSMFTVQVAPEDCTGCGACVNICPVKPKKALGFVDKLTVEEQEKENFAYFKDISGYEDVDKMPEGILSTQLKTPLLEFSGACSGCGETPYIKLLTQMYGDHLLIANASGCSSVFGGYMPTVPYTTRRDGTGPAWSNSLFEDNAEFGLGMRKGVDRIMEHAKSVLKKMSNNLRFPGFVNSIIENPQKSSKEIEAQRNYVKLLKEFLNKLSGDAVQGLLAVADFLVKKSVWVIGGDGWAYDIGYGGLDHVLASGENVKILVLDTEVYSNTGGQSSKATPLGALAKFASCGKALMKKPLAILQTLYGYIYVAQISMGANMSQTIRAFREAEEYPGPAVVVAYSHCISHGIDMMKGMDHGKRAVTCGIWPLFRYNPLLKKEGKNPLILDSGTPKLEVLEDYLYTQSRFKVIREQNPKLAERFVNDLKRDIMEQYKALSYRISE